MVAIKSAEADRVLARDLGSYSTFLVFGTDVGLVSERVRRVVAGLVDDAADPFQLVRLTEGDLSGDAARLSDEAGTVPLFGGRRAVLVDGGGKSVAAAVELYLETPAPCPVVIEAGALKRDAPLRKLIERSRRAAAIECYPDGEREISGLIDREVHAAGLTIEPHAKELLASLLGADRLASRSEIDKLLLYAHGQASIGVDDVEAAVADASAQAQDNTIDAAFSGDTGGLDAAVRRLHLNAVDAGQLVSAALRHAVMLQRAKLGGAAGAAWPARAAVPPRRKAAMEQQIAALGVDMLGRTVVRLGDALGQIRREPRLAEQHAIRALWTVALAARPRQRGR